MKYAINVSIIVCGALLLGSCGGRDNLGGGAETASSVPNAAAVSDFPQKIGAPYNVGTTTYTPEDVTDYDNVGYASYYGAERAGRQTANGEPFNPASISGAHKTLPLPSYVEVTALDTGRTILVRINDRGPFANDRLIDLSQAAAQQLGIVDQGVAGVRVRKVNPPEQERAILRSGSRAAERIDTPESLLKILRGKLAGLPKPAIPTRAAAPEAVANANPARTGAATRPVAAPPQLPSRAAPAASRPVAPRAAAPRPAAPRPVSPAASARDDGFVREGSGRSAAAPAATRDDGFVREGLGRSAAREGEADNISYVVQVASFSSRGRAADLARQLGGIVAVSADGGLFRVRYGPFMSEAEAQTALAKARQRGYPQAKIFRE